jgi:hypothetical protein
MSGHHRWIINPRSSLFVCPLMHSYVEYVKLLFSFHEKDITMTSVTISAAEPQKPTNPTPTTPQQQTQSNPQKPADKPSEQQK